MKKNKTRALTIRLEEDLIEDMEVYRNLKSINWSNKIRNFIKLEIRKSKKEDMAIPMASLENLIFLPIK